MITQFTRTTPSGQTLQFTVCAERESDSLLSVEQMVSSQLNSWLLIERKGIKTIYIYRGVIREMSSYPKSVSITYDILSMVDDLSEITRGGASYGLTQTWNDPILMSFFEPLKFDAIDKAKRGLNGILEREFGVLPIYNPLDPTQIIVAESTMMIKVNEYKAILAQMTI